MFKLVLDEVGILKDSINAIASFITEATFEITKDGLQLIAMDPASVAMVIFKMLPTAFSEYDVDEAQKITLSLGNLSQVLKRARSSDTLVLTLTEDKSRLKLIMKGTFTRTFLIPLIEGGEESHTVPNLEFDVVVEMDSSVLKEGIKDADMVSDSVIFEADAEKFLLYATGENSEVKLELTRDSPALISLQAKKAAKAKYSIDYLEKMLKGTKISENVVIKFSQDYPMQLDCKVLDRVQLSFILAPRVDV